MADDGKARVLLAAALGALALAALAGALLAVRYHADPAVARDDAAALGIARAVHAWGASLGLALFAVAGARAFLEAPSARAPLVAGVLALGAILAAFDLGAVLPFDQRAWETWIHAREGASLVGLTWADTPTAVPLGVILLAHVALTLVVLALAVPILRGWRPDRRAWLAALAAGAAVLALALVAPPSLGPAPIVDVASSRAHWPFVWLSPLRARLGPGGLLALPLALALALALALRPPATRRTRVLVLVSAGAVWALLTLAGAQP